MLILAVQMRAPTTQGSRRIMAWTLQRPSSTGTTTFKTGKTAVFPRPTGTACTFLRQSKTRARQVLPHIHLHRCQCLQESAISSIQQITEEMQRWLSPAQELLCSGCPLFCNLGKQCAHQAVCMRLHVLSWQMTCSRQHSFLITVLCFW